MKSPTKPEKPPLIKVCSSCGLQKPHSWMNTLKYYRHRCKDCHNEYNRQYRKLPKERKKHSKRVAKRLRKIKRETKRYLINLLGGKCQSCGLIDECPTLYDFHHRNPSEKDLNISQCVKITKELIREIKKCDLLCSNCHRRLHWKQQQLLDQKKSPTSL